MIKRVLLVDDEPDVLSDYRRQLCREFELVTAQDGRDGLDAIAAQGPFAVVVSDLRMPGMDGVEFLAEVKERDPDCVRMMLSGFADVETCIEAVNEGGIFRILTKPCSSEKLAKALNAALEQYRLVTSERELLQSTLTGSISMLTDLLSLLRPQAVTRGSRLRRYVAHMARELELEDPWQFELAATLSQIGLVIMPVDILTRIASGHALSAAQRQVAQRHPLVASRLLGRIPRFELIARMIETQNSPPPNPIIPEDMLTEEETVGLGAQLLRLAIDVDHSIARGLSFHSAIVELKARYGPLSRQVQALATLDIEPEPGTPMRVKPEELTTSMVALADIVDANGEVLASKGRRLTHPLVVYIQSCAEAQGVKEPLLVQALGNSR